MMTGGKFTKCLEQPFCFRGISKHGHMNLLNLEGHSRFPEPLQPEIERKVFDVDPPTKYEPCHNLKRLTYIVLPLSTNSHQVESHNVRTPCVDCFQGVCHISQRF